MSDLLPGEYAANWHESSCAEVKVYWTGGLTLEQLEAERRIWEAFVRKYIPDDIPYDEAREDFPL